MITRSQAAELIVTALEDDYSCSIWEKGGLVRVYLTEVTRKSKGRTIRRENGYLSIEADGSINTDHLDRQAGTIAGRVASLNLEIEAVAVQPVAAGSKVEKAAYQDEDVAQFEAEQIRELSRTGELPGA